MMIWKLPDVTMQHAHTRTRTNMLHAHTYTTNTEKTHAHTDEVYLQSDQVLMQLVDAKLEDLLVAAVVDAAEVISEPSFWNLCFCDERRKK